MPADEPGTTAIVVLTPEAEPVVGGLYRACASAGRDGMTPHVTLLVPFMPARLIDHEVERRLSRLFGRFERFGYHLRRFERFEIGVLYLAPEPPRPFVELVLALMVEFPEFPPYAGVHEDVVPHVTVADSDDPQLVGNIRAEVEPLLPIACRAEEATLVERGADLRWRPRSAFRFGSLE